MSDQSTRLHLPFLQSGQAQKHVTVNESLLRLDALVQLSVVSATLATEPASPVDGAIYILPSGKSGANWAAMANGALAYYRDGAWEQIAPREGWLAFIEDVDAFLVYSGTTWVSVPVGDASIVTSMLANDAVTYAKIQNISATDRLLGRASAGAGDPEEIVCTAAGRALLDDASAREQCNTLGAWCVLAKSGAASSVTGTTAETILATVAIPANAIGPNGVVRVTSLWKYPNSANTKTLKVQLGAVNFVNVTPTTTNSFQAVTTIWNRNAANSQVGPSSSAATDGAMGTEGSNPTLGAVDTSVAQNLTFKATLANAGETITLEAYLVEIAYGA